MRELQPLAVDVLAVPTIFRKEVLEVTHIRIRESSEHVSELFKGIDAQSFAGLCDSHERCSKHSLMKGCQMIGDSRRHRFSERELITNYAVINGVSDSPIFVALSQSTFLWAGRD